MADDTTKGDLGGVDPDDTPKTARVPPTEWHRVKEQHQEIVDSLNQTAVSFTARSAEGLAMYKGLESHTVNGHTRPLAKQGHISIATRVRAASTQRQEGTPGGSADVADTSQGD
jgi:hypothetical protein